MNTNPTDWVADVTENYAEVVQGGVAILRADKPVNSDDAANVRRAVRCVNTHDDLLRLVARYTEIVDAAVNLGWAYTLDFTALVEELEEVRSDAHRALAKAAKEVQP